MNLQKRLAGIISKRSPKKVKLLPERMSDLKEAITKADIRSLIKDKAIILKKKKGVSRARAKQNKKQKVKGRKRGQGSRKGTANARLNKKTKWINRIRLQRKLLKQLKKNKRITQETYKDLYRKSKGGFFRSKRHIKLYLTEHKLIE